MSEWKFCSYLLKNYQLKIPVILENQNFNTLTHKKEGIFNKLNPLGADHWITSCGEGYFGKNKIILIFSEKNKIVHYLAHTYKYKI